MNNILKYNNLTLPYPMAFVELSRENIYDNKFLGYNDTITLDGQLTGNFESLKTGQSGLLNIFSKNFGNFEIYEDNIKIYDKSGIAIRSINFDESNYNGILNYTVTLDSYSLSGNVINPANEFSFSENKDGTISLNHSISAQGVNTNIYPNKSNALDNAVAFVRQYTGVSGIPSTKFITGNSKFFIQSSSESIDRLSSTYSIEESYTSSILNTGYSGILNYSVDISSGVTSNAVNISINGTYQGDKDRSMNNLRNDLNITGLLKSFYTGYFNPIPLDYSVSENSGEKSINFNYSFDNINLPNPYFEYKTSVSRNELDQNYFVDVQGNIITRGNRKNKYELALTNISSLTGSLVSVATDALNQFKDFNGDLNSSNLRMVNIQIAENPNEGTISATANFDDKFMPTGGFMDANFQVSVEAPVWYINNAPTITKKGWHILNDFNIVSLPKLTVNTSFIVKNNTYNLESGLKNNIIDITNNIIPTNYNFSNQVREEFNTEKSKFLENGAINVKALSYRLEKIDPINAQGILPKIT